MTKRRYTADDVADVDAFLALNCKQFRELERAESVDLFHRQGFALVWRPGLAAPVRVTSLAEYDAAMR